MSTDLIQQFEAFFSNFGQADLAKLWDLYDPSVVFTDPVHSIQGLPALIRYFEQSRTNVSHCTFTFEHRTVEGDRGFFQWRMHYAHPQLAAGQPQILRGCSLIKIQQKVIYHEDFYDLGAMLYEHLPVLGWAVRKIKYTMTKG